MKSQTGKEIKTNYTQPIGRTLTIRMTDDRVCCENIAAAMFVTVKEMRAGPS